ncbi:MAG: STAS domain-containing protein [Ornithinibacter sp.]
MTIDEREDESGCHVTLRGRLDVRTVPDLRLTLHRVIAGGSSPLLLDLAEVQVGDATGFGLLVESVRRARRAGRPVHVVAADERTRRLLRRGRLGSVLSPAEPQRRRTAPELVVVAG